MIIGKFRENSEEVNMAESAHEIKDKMEEEEKDHNSDILTRFTNFVDNNLSWKSHISLLASKLSKSIGIIHKSRFFSLNSFSSNFVQFNDTSILILLQSSLGWHL